MELRHHFKPHRITTEDQVESYRSMLTAVTSIALSGKLWTDKSLPRRLTEVSNGELDSREAAVEVCADDGFVQLEFQDRHGRTYRRGIILSDLVRAMHIVSNRGMGEVQKYPRYYEVSGAPILPKVFEKPGHLDDKEMAGLRDWIVVAAFGDKAIRGYYEGGRK